MKTLATIIIALCTLVFTSCQKDNTTPQTGYIWVTNTAYTSDIENMSMNLDLKVTDALGATVYTSTIPEVWNPSAVGFEVIELIVGDYTLYGEWAKDDLYYYDTVSCMVIPADTVHIHMYVY